MASVSIIVPIYHGKEYIPSIIRQVENCASYLDSDSHVELLLVNDAPDEPIDESLSSGSISISVINAETNRGIQGTRIEGVNRSSGEYILLLDQDDIIYPRYLISQLDRIKDCDAVVCRLRHEGKEFYNRTRSFRKMITWDYMLKKGNPIISPGQVLMKRDVVPECWKKNILRHNGADDWFLWICMFKNKCNVVTNQEILFEHVVNGRNMSMHAFEMAESENEMLSILKKEQLLDKAEIDCLEHTLRNMVAARMLLLEKYYRLSFVYDEWMYLRMKGKRISEFLQHRDIKRAAIYGVTNLGKRLCEELEMNGIAVEYFIDANAQYLEEYLPVYNPEDSLGHVDLIIISLVMDEENIKKSIVQKHGMNVYTISELLYEMWVYYDC